MYMLRNLGGGVGCGMVITCDRKFLEVGPALQPLDISSVFLSRVKKERKKERKKEMGQGSILSME